MNETRTLRDFPNLPVLSLAQSSRVFKVANVGPTMVANWTGYSRVAVSGWMGPGQSNPNITTLETVSALAYRVLRALAHEHYPLKRTRQIPATALDALGDTAYDRPLSDYSAQELLPKTWHDNFNPARLRDATATVL